MKQENGELLAVALATGADVQDAATAAGISRTTVWRRLKNPEFLKLLREKIDELRLAAIDAWIDQLSPSIQKLIEIRDNPDVAPSVQLNAAIRILDYCYGRIDLAGDALNGPMVNGAIQPVTGELIAVETTEEKQSAALRELAERHPSILERIKKLLPKS